VGCRGNYDQRKGVTDDNKVSVFRFLKDVDRLTQWLHKIPQDLTVAEITHYAGVCELHLDPTFDIREMSALSRTVHVVGIIGVARILDGGVPSAEGASIEAPKALTGVGSGEGATLKQLHFGGS
jgi:hypothetical protein